MEVVSGVASVVGILAFTGQATKGLLTLKQLLTNVRGADETVRDLLEAIRLLRITINDVENVGRIIEKLPRQDFHEKALLNSGALMYQTKACVQEMSKWIKIVRDCDPRTQKGFKAILRKLQVATEKDSLHGIQTAILAHQQRIGIGLSALLVSLGLVHNQHVQKTTESLTEAHLKLNNLANENRSLLDTAAMTHEGIIAILLAQQDQRDRASQSSQSSVPSLQSIQDTLSDLGSQISRIEARLSYNAVTFMTSTAPRPTATAENWGCSAMLGIEECFIDDTCIYCKVHFATSTWKHRGHHLIVDHAFGSCNMEVWYGSWSAMQRHLHDCHNRALDDPQSKGDESHFRIITGEVSSSTAQYLDTAASKTQYDHDIRLIARLAESHASFLPFFDEVRGELQEVQACFNTKLNLVGGRLSLLIQTGKIDKLLNVLWRSRRGLAGLYERLAIEAFNTTIPFAYGKNALTGNILLLLSLAAEWNEIELGIKPLFGKEDGNSHHDIPRPAERVNDWLKDVLIHSSSARILLAQRQQPAWSTFQDCLAWLTNVQRFWLTDGATLVDVESHPASDGAVNSKDYMGAVAAPAPAPMSFTSASSPTSPASRVGSLDSVGSSNSLLLDLAVRRGRHGVPSEDFL